MKTRTKQNREGSITIEGDMNINDPIEFEQFIKMVYGSDENDAITLLKSKGYVIFKPSYEKL